MSEPEADRSALREAADVVLLMAAGVGLLLGVIWFALRTGVGARVDQDVVESFRIDRFSAGPIDALLREIRIPTMVLLTLVAMAVAAAGRQWRMALALPLLVVGANQSTQALKNDLLTSVPRDPSLNVTLPSGHSTAAISLAAVAIIAAPRAVRPLVCLLAGAIAGGAGLGTMAERWHRPADVIAAVAVVLIWSAIALLISAQWATPPLVRAAGFDRAVGHAALATLGVAGGIYVLHRLGMTPMDGSKAHTLAYGSLAVVGVVIGLGLGVVAVVADRRVLPVPRRPGRGPGRPGIPGPAKAVTHGSTSAAAGARD